MKLVALEEHVLPPDDAALMRTADLPQVIVGPRSIREKLSDVTARLAAMDAVGIDVQVLSSVPPLFKRSHRANRAPCRAV